jgi:hypothetical protein
MPRNVPGTWEGEPPPYPVQVKTNPLVLRAIARDAGEENVRSLKQYVAGECMILVGRERVHGEHWLWHMTISCKDRYPTWDEIKAARYRLLSNGLTFGMLMPPPEQYVNVEAQDHVFHLWEITDPRKPWEDL